MSIHSFLFIFDTPDMTKLIKFLVKSNLHFSVVLPYSFAKYFQFKYAFLYIGCCVKFGEIQRC